MLLIAGSAVGFKLDSLLKLSDTRARNNKMTLMHYLCKVDMSKSSNFILHFTIVSLGYICLFHPVETSQYSSSNIICLS